MDNNFDSIKELLSHADESLQERASAIDQKKKKIEMEAIDAIVEIESILESLSPVIELKGERASSAGRKVESDRNVALEVNNTGKKPAEELKEKIDMLPATKPPKASDANDFDAHALRILKAAETGDENFLKEKPTVETEVQPHVASDEENVDISTEQQEENAANAKEDKPEKKRTLQIEEEKSNPIKGILMGLITIVFIAAAAIALILTFFPDSSVGYNINKLLGREVQAPANQNGNAEDQEGNSESQSTETVENQGTDKKESSQGKAPTSGTIIGKAILSKIDLAEGIKRVEESGELRFVIEKDYGVEGITEAISFDDDIWYMSNHTENIHYTPEIVGFVIDYYSKLYKRINKDDDAVLNLIVPESKLMGDVSAIKKDAVVLHHLNKLELGEIRRNGNEFYMMVRLSESTNDGKPDSQVTKVLRMTTENKEIKMAEIVDSI